MRRTTRKKRTAATTEPRMRKGKYMDEASIIILTGPSGSGKGSVIDCLPDNYIKAVSATTRAPRSGEKEGVDYYFISTDDFRALLAKDGMAEYNYYDGQYYGTPRSEIADNLARGRRVVLDVDVNGAHNLKKAYPEARMIFIIPPSAAEQEARLRARQTNSEESIRRRLERTREELACAEDFDCVLINRGGHLQETVAAFLDAVRGKYPDPAQGREALQRYFD